MAAFFPHEKTAWYYSGNQIGGSGYRAVTRDTQVLSIEDGKEIRMAPKQLRNLQAQPVRNEEPERDEALESLLHMTSWAREAAVRDEARLSSRSPRLAVLVDGIAIGAVALYPGSWPEAELVRSVATAAGAPPSEDRDANTPLERMAGITRPIGGVLARAWRYLRHRRQAGRAAATLSRLDDRALRDIGISRAEIGYVSLHGRDLDRWR